MFEVIVLFLLISFFFALAYSSSANKQLLAKAFQHGDDCSSMTVPEDSVLRRHFLTHVKGS